MTVDTSLTYLQTGAAKGAVAKVGKWILAAVGPLFVVEPKLLALFVLLSFVDIATAGLFAEGKVIRSRRGKAALDAVYRFLQNLVGATVLVWISNGFAFFTFLGSWVIAYVCLRVARHIINAITPAESDLRALWDRFWRVFYDRNADVIETTAGDSMRKSFRQKQGIDDGDDIPVPYVLPDTGSPSTTPGVEDAPPPADPYGDLL